LGSYTLVVAPIGVKFDTEEGTFGPLLRAKFHPHRCNMSPLRGEKPQNRPLSKRNTGRFALRAMLPVITRQDTRWPTKQETTTTNYLLASQAMHSENTHSTRPVIVA